jgi:hypothetical protein
LPLTLWSPPPVPPHEWERQQLLSHSTSSPLGLLSPPSTPCLPPQVREAAELHRHARVPQRFRQGEDGCRLMGVVQARGWPRSEHGRGVSARAARGWGCLSGSEALPVIWGQAWGRRDGRCCWPVVWGQAGVGATRDGGAAGLPHLATARRCA